MEHREWLALMDAYANQVARIPSQYDRGGLPTVQTLQRNAFLVGWAEMRSDALRRSQQRSPVEEDQCSNYVSYE